MDVSNLHSYYIIEKLKINVAKWGTPKKYFKKENGSQLIAIDGIGHNQQKNNLIVSYCYHLVNVITYQLNSVPLSGFHCSFVI